MALRSWKNRKCPKWLVPMTISKPSAVKRFPGVSVTPALLTSTLSLSLLERKSAAADLTLDRSLRSMRISSIETLHWLVLSISWMMASPFSLLRTVKKSLAPVACRAFAVNSEASSASGDDNNLVAQFANKALILDDLQSGGASISGALWIFVFLCVWLIVGSWCPHRDEQKSFCTRQSEQC